MEYIRWEFAPGARWQSVSSFAAPVGMRMSQQNKATRHIYQFNVGEIINVRAVCEGRLLIQTRSGQRATNFATGSTWMEPTWVSHHWLAHNFRFNYNENTHLWRLTRYGSPYSVLGTDRIITDEDAWLELGIAADKFEMDIVGHYYSNSCNANSCNAPQGSQNLEYGIRALQLLKQNGMTSNCCADSVKLGDMPLKDFIRPFQGMIVCHGLFGDDHQKLRERFPRVFTTFEKLAAVVFMIETDEDFFEARLAMDGPHLNFIHREQTLAATG